MLRTAKWVLRALVFLNFFVGVPLLLLLGWSFVDESRFVELLGRASPDADLPALLTGLRLAFATIAPVMVAAHLLLTRLLAVLHTVSQGDPFVSDNADRLRTVAWCLLAIQLCDLLFGYGVTMADMASGETVSGWSPGITGWVAVLLTFILAGVFREGARLRSDAELTV